MKQETLLDQRKRRIGPNDYKRNMRAKRSSDRATLIVLAAAVLFLFSSTLSASQEDATVWKKECQRYFLFKEPRIVYYKDHTPTVWCSIESQKILKGETTFDYKNDTQ
jgi:hypothetical protein